MRFVGARRASCVYTSHHLLLEREEIVSVQKRGEVPQWGIVIVGYALAGGLVASAFTLGFFMQSANERRYAMTQGSIVTRELPGRVEAYIYGGLSLLCAAGVALLIDRGVHLLWGSLPLFPRIAIAVVIVVFVTLHIAFRIEHVAQAGGSPPLWVKTMAVFALASGLAGHGFLFSLLGFLLEGFENPSAEVMRELAEKAQLFGTIGLVLYGLMLVIVAGVCGGLALAKSRR